MYEKGDGGPASFDDAELCFRHAAESGNATARRYLAELLGDRAAHASADPPEFRRTQAANGLPYWEWVGNYRVFRLAMPDAGTVAISIVEDDGLTNGHAGIPPFDEAVPLATFLADGPPLDLVDVADLGVLLRVAEAFCRERGVAESDWLVRLRFHNAARVGSLDDVRDRFAQGNRATIRDRVGGRDALYWAVSNGRVAMVRLLLRELGCDPNGLAGREARRRRG